jgi:hypothetical protein
MANSTSTIYGQSYLDFAETWQYLQFPGSPGAQQQNLLQRYIESACSYAQGAEGANRPIAPTEFRERHDGWSGEYILLHHSPFLELVVATENQSTGGAIPLLESTPENGVDGIQIDYATSLIMRTFDGIWPKPFFPGSRNIEVTYLAGFNPLPPELWEATMELVAWKWHNSQQASRGAGPQPKGAESFEDTANANPSAPGCPPDIQAIFRSFRKTTIG